MADVATSRLRLNVVRMGSGEEVIVLVHGMVVDNLSSWYMSLAPVLAKTHSLVLYDLRGHGLSERTPAGYTMDDLLLGWRPTAGSVSRIVILFFAGLLLNASKIAPIRAAADSLPPVEAALRVGFGCIVVLFSAGIPEELVYRWGLQTRLERSWGRMAAIVVTAILFTAWHLPTRYFLAEGAEGTAGDLGSVLIGTGLPVLLVALVLGWAWDRWRNLPALVLLHWGVDTLPSVASLLRLPIGEH